MHNLPHRLFRSATVRGASLLGLLYLVISIFILGSCDNYDAFTTERSELLSFSSDSIRFDTLITTIPSATKTLIVHNFGERGLRIVEVRLAQGADSPFRINVDGQDLSRTSDNRATDFEVRRRDSIFVRCEVTVPQQPVDTAVSVQDAIIFTLESGVSQTVVLTAGGQNAFFMRGRTITADTTFTARRPIIVYDSLVVAPGATLTLDPGTQLLFHEKAGLLIGGRVVANGTLDAPVILRGDRTDHIFDYLTYDRMPGRWEGVIIRPQSAENQFNYMDLHSACYGIVCDTTATDTAAVTTLTLTNCKLHNIGGDGLRLNSCRTVVKNTEVSNTSGRCVAVIGGVSDFIHCTIAQFYPFTADRGEALFLTNIQDGTNYRPLHRLSFVNSVITGYAEDVLLGDLMPNTDFLGEYFFRNCLIATEEVNDPLRFIEIVYDVRPKSSYNLKNDDDDYTSWHNFKLIDTDNFFYDFTPVEQSRIRNIADPNYCQDLPLDRLGRSRFADGAPDAGCYEYQ